MKVIDGNFGKEEEGQERPTLLEAVTAALKEIESTEEREGCFFMCVNTPKRYTFITNELNAAELIALLEVSKAALVQNHAENM